MKTDDTYGRGKIVIRENRESFADHDGHSGGT
jgi:hypothetical protein